MSQPLPANNLRIYDVPSMGAQVHIHGDAAGGRIYDYSRQSYTPLNAYESAMAELHAQQLGIQPITKTTKK
ncbi:MAG: hypothetical protein KDA69_15650 [Planctomycetaceae bacterium]|nr:hypothetical protein [Planctomycetaceae bacterium]